jgi:hypothetical protein
MKKLFGLFSALCLGTASAQPYGTVTYPYAGAILSSAKMITSPSPGHLMAGYEPLHATNNYNFIINKTGPNGGYGPGSNAIRKRYTVSRTGWCNTPGGPWSAVNNCEGVTAIETNQTAYPYAVAGTADYGCWFATLDINGFVASMAEYPFPFPQSGNGKPLLIASTQVPNVYYIVGKWNDMVYTMAVNNLGTLLWQKIWQLAPGVVFEPKAMIEAPPMVMGFAGELVIVGHYLWPGFSNATDGFLMKLDYSNGNLNLFKGYDGTSPNVEQGFTDIKFLGGKPQKYAICGWNMNPSHNGWLIELTSAGSIVWTTHYGPASDPFPSKVAALVARVNSSSAWEFHVASYSSLVGLQVCKFDATGLPFSTGSNEGVNNAGFANPSSAVNIDFRSNTTTTVLTAYGDADALTPGTLFMSRSYFNEVSGCGSTLTGMPYNNDPYVIISLTPTLNPASMPTCTQVTLHWVDVVVPVTQCGPFASVNGGSNARFSVTGIAEQETETMAFTAFPNPANSKTTITFGVAHDGAHVKLELYDGLGRLVKTLSDGKMNTGNYNSEVDLKALELESGMYVISLRVDGKTSNTKLLYTK